METTPKKKGKLTYVLLGIGAVATLGLTYYFSKRSKATSSFEPEEVQTRPPVTTTTSSKPPKLSSSSTHSSFPLKKGSRGTKVRELQHALIKKYGPSILPKWKADGVWGSELESALIKKGHPTFMNGNTFYDTLNKLTQSSTSSGSSSGSSSNAGSGWKFDPLRMANIFHYAIKNHKFDKVQELLTLLKSPSDYNSVSIYFRSREMYDGTKRTLLRGLFHKFRTSWGKKTLNTHFHRIGLKYDGKNWSLNGTGSPIKTLQTARIWDDTGKAMIVPAGTVLGEFLSSKNGITSFQTLDGQILFIHTSLIHYV